MAKIDLTCAFCQVLVAAEAETLIKLTGRRIVPTTVIEGHAPIIGLNYAAINSALTNG